MSDDWADACAAFTEGAAWFVTTVGRVGDRWTRPGLGDWDVRALVGHTSRALLTVEEYAARPATDVVATSAAASASRRSAASTGRGGPPPRRPRGGRPAPPPRRRPRPPAAGPPVPRSARTPLPRWRRSRSG